MQLTVSFGEWSSVEEVLPSRKRISHSRSFEPPGCLTARFPSSPPSSKPQPFSQRKIQQSIHAFNDNFWRAKNMFCFASINAPMFWTSNAAKSSKKSEMQLDAKKIASKHVQLIFATVDILCHSRVSLKMHGMIISGAQREFAKLFEDFDVVVVFVGVWRRSAERKMLFVIFVDKTNEYIIHNTQAERSMDCPTIFHELCRFVHFKSTHFGFN